MEEHNSTTSSATTENIILNQDDLILEQKKRIELEIIETVPLLGDKEHFETLLKEYTNDDIYTGKVRFLMKNYSNWRRTRPDGNCFYRAFSYAYLEYLLDHQEELARFYIHVVQSKDKLMNQNFPQFTVEDFHATFVEILDRMLQKHGVFSLAELHKLFNEAAYSEYVVVFLRLITSSELRQRSSFYENFIDGNRSVDQFCKQEVEPMYRESDHIHITALTNALGVSVKVRYMDRGDTDEVTAHDFNADGDKEPLVHLLYRPGHYDILYI